MPKQINDEQVSQMLHQCAKMFGSSKKADSGQHVGDMPALSGATHNTPAKQSTQAAQPDRPNSSADSNMLGRYRLLQLIGEGGMGKVYKAFDPLLERVVAVKLLNGVAMHELAPRQRFMREAQSIARLCHPHIVAVHDFQENAGEWFLIMQFVDGCSLEKKLRQEWLSLPQVCHFMLDMLDAVGYACNKGVVHRDLKPSNILLDRQGNLYISDFGLAKVVDGDVAPISRAGQILGTPAYMAPEQAQTSPDNPVDAQSDIYSLGVIMFEMMTGRTPFHSDKVYQILYRLTHDNVADPRTLRPELPEALVHICLKALQRDKASRYADADQMAEDIRGYLAQTGRATPQPATRRVNVDTELTRELPRAQLPATVRAAIEQLPASPAPRIANERRPLLVRLFATSIVLMLAAGIFFSYQTWAKRSQQAQSAKLQPVVAAEKPRMPGKPQREEDRPARPDSDANKPHKPRPDAPENVFFGNKRWWELSEKERSTLLDKFDLNRDGRMSPDEWRRMVRQMAGKHRHGAPPETK